MPSTRPAALAACLLLALLPGCFTVTVWGGSIEEDEHDRSTHLSLGGGEPISDRVWVKLLATPVALLLDLCTAPVQIVLFNWDEDDC